MDAQLIAQAKVIDAKNTGSANSSSNATRIDKALPAGETVTAKITQISPETAQNSSHRVKLEINNSLLQISVKFSGPTPTAGSTISLQRSDSGQIQLKVLEQPPQAAAKSDTAVPTKSNSTLTAGSNVSSNSKADAPLNSTSNAALLNLTKTDNVTLKVPVTINASGSALAAIEQFLPKGTTVDAKVLNQNNIAATKTLNTASSQTINVPSTNTVTNNQTQTAVANYSVPSTLNKVATSTNVTNQIATNSNNTNTTTASSSISNPAPAKTNTQAPTNTTTTTTPTTPAQPSTTQPNLTSATLKSSPTNSPNNTTVSSTPLANQGTSSSNTYSIKQVVSTVTSPTIVANAPANTAPPLAQAAAPTQNTSTQNQTSASQSPAPVAATTPSAANSASTVPSSNTLPPPASVISTTPATQNIAATSTNHTTSSLLPEQKATATLTKAAPASTNTTPSTLSTNIARTIATPLPTVSSPNIVVNSPVQSTPQPLPSLANNHSTQFRTVESTPISAATTPKPISQPTVTSTLQPNTAAPASATQTTTLSNAPQNLQLQALPTNTTAVKISVAGQVITLQAPANLPPLQNVQITRTQGVQANIQWQQPAQSTPTTVTQPSLTPKQIQLVEQNLRQALPIQIPIAEGINQLVAQTAQFANSPNSAAAQIDKVALSIMQMFGVKPGNQNSSSTIKRNVQQGGLFTESKLLSQPGGQQGDMKSFLAKLSKLAEQLPPEQKEMLQSTSERMLARVTTQQLTHVQQQQHAKADPSNERTFQIDIPVQSNEKLDNVKMEIKQRKHLTQEGDFVSIWSVKLHFDLEERGEVDAEIALNPIDNSISTTFLCTKLSTVQQIEQRMTGFRNQLHQQGFEIQTLHCTQGSQAANANNPINKRIIDIRT